MVNRAPGRVVRLGVIDTHCHLTFPDFRGREERVLADAAAAGVTGAITISTTTKDCLEAMALAHRFENVWCTSGIHPLHSHEGPHAWENLRRVAADARCVAWGELGLDNHYATPDRAHQRAVLDEHLAFIRSCRSGPSAIDKPLVIHCREAFDDLIPVLKASGLPAERMVFHCFTGGPEEAKKVLDFGAWLSFTGVLTYRNAPQVREAAALAPADRVMVETDAPFLSPEPKRGVRPCEPAMTRLTAERLALVRGVSFGAMCEQLDANTERFFGVRAPAQAGSERP